MEQIIEAKKILVRAPNWVGDVVMATPAFRCIRENFADSHITLLIKKNLRGIIDGSPWFDEVIELESKVGKSKNGFVFTTWNIETQFGSVKKEVLEPYSVSGIVIDIKGIFRNRFSFESHS